MAYNAVIVSGIILTSVSFYTMATKDCALAGKPNKNDNPPKETNARRQAKVITDVIGPAMKFKFGITYPYGVHPHKGYTPDKVTLKTPPTNFFPLGSSVYTITMHPLPHLFLHEHSKGYLICDFLIRACMRVYDTGYVCAHSVHGVTFTFTNYCAMEFTNCRINANLWQLSYFGSCLLTKMPDNNEDFDIEGDNFLESAVINEPPFNPLTGQQESVF